jgi:hypothetical protein
MEQSTDERDAEMEALRQRVKELEDTVLYLSNTLAMNGLINSTEAGVARQMYGQARDLREQYP